MVSERALLVYRRALHILYITVNPPGSGMDSDEAGFDCAKFSFIIIRTQPC